MIAHHDQLSAGLHKTISGKIMRRILRKVAHKDYACLGGISTLLNPEVVEGIIVQYKEGEFQVL